MTHRSHIRAGLAALTVVTALTGSGAVHADPTDLRSPDARDAGVQAGRSSAVVPGPDLRSPDARDAGIQARRSAGVVPADLRSPDARDAGTLDAATPATTVRTSADTFHVDDAAVGAAGTLGLVLIVTGGSLPSADGDVTADLWQRPEPSARKRRERAPVGCAAHRWVTPPHGRHALVAKGKDALTSRSG
jgi:hypothetical protein